MLKAYQPTWMRIHNEFVQNYTLVIGDDTGRIVAVGPTETVMTQYPGIVTEKWPNMALVPGTVNTHSHSFQHLLRGLGVDQPFLVWREQALYRVTPHLHTQALYLGAKLAFSEMVLQGITTVVDFFYLHDHGIDNDLAIIQAAQEVGIRLVLARTFYDWEGAPESYRETPEEAVARTETLAARYRNNPMVSIHPAPHSVHGASDAMIEAAVTLARDLNTPYHMHIAEERFEIEEQRAKNGLSPVEHLAQLEALDSSLIAVHLTWATAQDAALLGQASANLAYCPSSNMFLADGVTPLRMLRTAGVEVALGSDGGCSNNRASVYEEMRMAALVQKVDSLDATVLTHQDVWKMGTEQGARMLRLDAGTLEENRLADFVGIDLTHLSLLPWSQETLLANIVYSMSPAAVQNVVVAGRVIVKGGELQTQDTAALFQNIQQLREQWM